MSVDYQRGTIRLQESGLKRICEFADGSTSIVELKWTEIRQVIAFKRDLFAFDLLCIEFRTTNLAVETDEQMQGWDEMIAALPECLPITLQSDEWWNNVAHPAFAPKITQLFPPVV